MNVVGSAYGLTILSPIAPGRDASGAPHETAIRTILAQTPTAAGSPFARLTNVHLARWVVLDDAFYESYRESVDHYASKYLLFTACFDGALEEFLEALRTRAAEEVQQVWSHCTGFPGVGDAGAFARYMRHCQIDTTFLFAAYPTSSLPQVLRALDAQRRFVAFLARHQGDGDEALQRAFRSFMSELQRAPTPAPATA
ncbi:MAG: hypothetical protein ACT4P7_20605 [Gemmatimonadaceae bacterium]